MEIIKESSAGFNKSVLILGFFDGIHLGHRDVITSAANFAKNNNVPAAVLTFPKSPAEYFGENVNYIYKREKSYSIMEKLCVDYIIEQDFHKIMNLSSEEYIKKISAQYNPIAIFSGFNYTFGKNKEGNTKTLHKYAEKYNYKYFEIPANEFSGQIISSTYIKTLLHSGSVQEANQLLEEPFTISGKVITGAHIGRTIGFPTANIIYPKNIVKLPYGVYKAEVLGRKAIANFGIRPTFENREECLEVHVLNFDDDLYNQNLEVDIIDKIRTEKKFENISELKKQIIKDIKECLK